MVPRSGSDDHEIPVASSASLPSPLTLLSLSQCLCLERHPRRNDKSPLVLHSSPLNSLLPHHVASQALCHDQHILTSVCYCHPAAIPHHLPKQGALWSSSWSSCWRVSGMDPPGIPPDLSIVKLCNSNPFLWSLNLEPPGGTGCPPPSSFHRTKWEGSLWYRDGCAGASMKMCCAGLGKGAMKLVHPQPYTNTSSPATPALPSHCSLGQGLGTELQHSPRAPWQMSVRVAPPTMN